MPTKSTEKKPAYKDPLRATNDVDPIKTRIKTPKPYEDPLRVRPKTFKPEPYKFEYKPYNSYHEYKPSNIDPLTGRPYRARRRQYKDEPKEQKNEDPEPIQEKTKPRPAAVFPLRSSTVGSTKRTLNLMEQLQF